MRLPESVGAGNKALQIVSRRGGNRISVILERVNELVGTVTECIAEEKQAMPKRKHLQIILLSCLFCFVWGNAMSQSKRNHSDLAFWTVGNTDGMVARFGVNVRQALSSLKADKAQLDGFLLTISEQPLTRTEIIERSGLAESQVDHFISKLDSAKLIKKDDQARWVTTIPVITDNQMRIIRKDLARMASNVVEYLKKETPRLKAFYDEVKSPMDPPWEVVSHLIIDKFIIDGTFHSSINRLKEEKDVRELGRQRQRATPAFFLEVGENFSNFGCNWYPYNELDDQREVYVLHGGVLHRHEIAMNKYRGDQHFSAALFKITPEGGLHSLTSQEKEMLRYLNWISNDSLLVPIVNAITIKRLWPTIEELGKDAAILGFGSFADITDSYKKAPHSGFLDEDDDYVQVCIHVLFGLTIEHLVNTGVVARIPNPVPESFGVYVVNGKLF